MKKVVKIICITAGALFCLAFLFYIGIGILWSADFDFPVTEIAHEVSPDGRYEITVEQLGSPVWPFGPVTSRVTVKSTERGKRIARFKDEVSNDGAGLYAGQFTFEWHDTEVKIIIDPAESSNIEHIVELE